MLRRHVGRPNVIPETWTNHNVIVQLRDRPYGEPVEGILQSLGREGIIVTTGDGIGGDGPDVFVTWGAIETVRLDPEGD